MAHAAPMARDERRLSQSSPPGSTARTRVQKREESVENRSSCYHVGRPNGPTKDNPLYPRLLVRGYTGSEEGEQDLYEPGQPAELVTWELSWKSSKGSELDSESPNFVRLTKSEVESAYIQELDLENYSFALPTSMAPCDH